ncbi:MAG: hypothetical protein AAFY39_13905 [Pseudomonadota bacterium]
MSDPKPTRTIRWLNFCVVAFALLVAGVAMAIMYLLVPVFFWFVVAMYALKCTYELWVWRRLSAQERIRYAPPFHLMNCNFAVPVRVEWILFGAGFLGFLGWIEYARSVSG